MATDAFSEAIEVIPGRYFVAFLKPSDTPHASAIASRSICYCIDNELLYEPFYADFGPLNLGKTYRFCEQTKQLLQEADKCGKPLYLYTGPQLQAKANAAVLVGIFQVLYLDRSPDDAYRPLACQAPYLPFRDASCGVPTFNLQPIDCIRGIAKAREVGFLDASGGTWRFDLAEYEHYEQVENGDLNWIVPGKLVAFSGPAVRPTDYVGFRAMVPEDYWDYFSRRGVQAVVRLNKKVYERKRFLDGGFQHHELYFPDGSCPSQDILLRFLALAEATPGALAVHCKAGLGRTGVLICSYIMKHYGFTAEEVIGYIRVCRPGSVIGPQQGFIRDIQHIMWAEGDAYRSAHGPHPPPLMWGLTAAAAAKAAAGSKGRASAAAAAAAGPINLLVDATGQQVVVTRGSPGSARLVPASQGQLASAPVTPAAGVHGSLTDLSLKQLQERLTHSSISAATASNTAGASSRARGVTPQRLLSASSSATQQQQLPATSFSARHSSSQMTLRGSPVGGGSVNGGIAGRSMSASRDRPASHSGTGAIASGSVAGSLLAYAQPSLASLRATLHTDTVTAAARHKVQPQAPISQSSDFVGSGWRTPLTSSGSGSGSSSAGSTIARVLAPNGQPRKMPASALAGLAGSGSGSGAAKGMQSPGTPVQQGAQHGRLSAYYS